MLTEVLQKVNLLIIHFLPVPINHPSPPKPVMSPCPCILADEDVGCVKGKRAAFDMPKNSQRASAPVVDVVVLASPPPVLVGEAVDLQKLFFAQA